jgi:hypothetical protein
LLDSLLAGLPVSFAAATSDVTTVVPFITRVNRADFVFLAAEETASVWVNLGLRPRLSSKRV